MLEKKRASMVGYNKPRLFTLIRKTFFVFFYFLLVLLDEDSYQINECNAQYTDHVLPRRKNKKKNKNKDREDTGSTEVLLLRK